MQDGPGTPECLGDNDAMDAGLIRQGLEDRDQEFVPFELVKRIASGEHPVRVWREHRGMKAAELATSAGIAASYLSHIENGRRPGSVKALKSVANALSVGVDDLIELKRDGEQPGLAEYKLSSPMHSRARASRCGIGMASEP